MCLWTIIGPAGTFRAELDLGEPEPMRSGNFYQSCSFDYLYSKVISKIMLSKLLIHCELEYA